MSTSTTRITSTTTRFPSRPAPAILTRTATSAPRTPTRTFRTRITVTSTRRKNGGIAAAVFPVSKRTTGADAPPAAHSFRYGDQGHAIIQAVGEDEVSVPRHRGVTYDVAAARDCPGLELLGL